MLSKVNSVISDCLGETVPSLFVPEPKTFGHTQACRSGKGWRFFSLYGCGKNTTPCPIAWTGYVRPAIIRQAMGGRIVFFLLRSHPARRRGYGSAGRTCSVQVGRDGGIKQHSHEYYRSSFPKQSRQVPWPLPLPQRFFSSHAVLTGSIYSEVGCWLYLHRR